MAAMGGGSAGGRQGIASFTGQSAGSGYSGPLYPDSIDNGPGLSGQSTDSIMSGASVSKITGAVVSHEYAYFEGGDAGAVMPSASGQSGDGYSFGFPTETRTTYEVADADAHIELRHGDASVCALSRPIFTVLTARSDCRSTWPCIGAKCCRLLPALKTNPIWC